MMAAACFVMRLQCLALPQGILPAGTGRTLGAWQNRTGTCLCPGPR